MFYVYEWFILETQEIFYVGKGCKGRYKSTSHRNKLFSEFIKRFNCSSRIIKYFDSEEEAFLYEKSRISELKKSGFCCCNLDNGGTGGVNFVWTEEMKKYKSIYNPMKSSSQRKRMSENNPMKNPEIAKKVRQKTMRPVIINGIKYEGVKTASIKLGVRDKTISTWCKRGYDTNGNPCRYENEPQKEYPLIKKTHPKVTNSKPVIIDDVKFETVKDAAKYLGVWSESLIKAIKDNRKCKGHSCRYDNQQPSQRKSDNSTLEGSTTNE